MLNFIDRVDRKSSKCLVDLNHLRVRLKIASMSIFDPTRANNQEGGYSTTTRPLEHDNKSLVTSLFKLEVE